MIPAVAHFVWLNQELPWILGLSLNSAARHGGFERLVLHHDPSLSPVVAHELAAIRGLVLQPLDTRALLLAPGLDLPVESRAELYARYSRLRSPAARSNVLRVAILAREGGVYLDMDTLTIRDLAPLRAASAFCGREHLAFPRAHGSSSRLPSARGLLRAGVRGILARAPGGFRAFRHLTSYYPAAVNNAILGARAGHALPLELLGRMAALSESELHRRYALGTHLLQDVVRTSGERDLSVLPPAVFYPLGPVMSQHWFRYTSHADLGEVLSSETHVVHWYASLRTQRQQRELDAESVQRDAGRQLFSALVSKLGLVPASPGIRPLVEPTKKTSPSSLLP